MRHARAEILELTGINSGTRFASGHDMSSCATCTLGRASAVGRGGHCPFVTRRRGAGEQLYLQGEPASAVWFLKEGTVALLRELPGRERVRAIRAAGSVMGLELLVHDTYLDTARALTEVSVCVLSRTGLDGWLGDPGTPSRALLEQSVRGLLADAPRGAAPDGNATRRVARWILDAGDASEVPRHMIASLLGMAPETLSRSLADLRTRGAIAATRRTLSICDRDALGRAAGEEPAPSPDGDQPH
jgi:CRP-like cAMP-binding protein